MASKPQQGAAPAAPKPACAIIPFPRRPEPHPDPDVRFLERLRDALMTNGSIPKARRERLTRTIAEMLDDLR
jgi:hypothetical protein